MSSPASRQDAEHRLANLVARWVAVREEKATTVADYNADLKKIEEAIEKLSAEIQGGGFQAALPFDPGGAPATEAQVERLAAQARASGITGAERREDGSTVVKMGEDCTLTIPPTKNPGTLAGDVVEGLATAGLAVEAGKSRKAAHRG